MKTKEKIYAEIGFGNDTFISTEVEKGKKEYRMDEFIKPKKVNGIYLRIWVLKKVLIISTYNGFKIITKNKNKFKLLFGVEGIGLRKKLK